MAEKVIARALPPEAFLKYAEALAKRTPPSLVANVLREALQSGLSAEIDLDVSGLKVRGKVVLRTQT